MMALRSLAGCGVLLLLAHSVALAIDHDNLDEGRPLRIEDPYPIAAGESAVEAGAGVAVPNRARAHAVLPVEILSGFAPNAQLGIGTTILSDPKKDAEQRRSGDLRVSALYNFNQETLAIPALGLRLSATVPTGTDSSGTEIRIKGLMTKSVGRWSFHFNPAYEFITDVPPDQRSSRYEFALGASYPVGAPRYTRLTVLADLFTLQSLRAADPNRAGAEAGFRYQWTPWTVLDVGLGTEFLGRSAERTAFFMTAGLSVGF